MIVTSSPQSNTSPSAGGHAFGSHDNNGGSDGYGVGAAGSGPSSDSDSSSARWFNFAAVSGQITQIRVIFNWSIDGDFSIGITGPEGGNGSASWSVNIDAPGGGVNRSDGGFASGPGGSDSGNISDGGTYDVTIPANTSIPGVSIEITTEANAEVGAEASSSANVSVSISNIRLEVTTLDGNVIVIM